MCIPGWQEWQWRWSSFLTSMLDEQDKGFKFSNGGKGERMRMLDGL
jgi:hypothetical protein